MNEKDFQKLPLVEKLRYVLKSGFPQDVRSDLNRAYPNKNMRRLLNLLLTDAEEMKMINQRRVSRDMVYFLLLHVGDLDKVLAQAQSHRFYREFKELAGRD